MRVLIVDDSALMRGMLQEVLEGLGHEVVGQAERVSQAVEAYRSTRPDLVALDISLVDGDGLSVLRRIKELDAAAKVVMITANDQKKTREEAAAAGAAGFLAKPFTAQEVSALVEGLASS